MSDARASAPPKLDAGSTRGLHMRSIMRGRAAAYALAIGVAGTFVFGAWLGEPLAMLAGLLAVVALVLGVAYVVAGRRSEEEFFASFARARGLTYARRTKLLPLTPLLGAGDRRECRHWMQGPLGDRLPACGLGHYEFRVRHGDGDVECWASHDFTICVADLEPGIVMFPGVFLTRPRDLVDRVGGGAWLSTHTRRRVELESAALCERYDLWVEHSQDDLLLRQLFSPAFVAWLAEHPLRPCFEYRSGTLVVYLERRLEDAGHLGWLIDATAEIAGRFLAEVRQAVGRHAA